MLRCKTEGNYTIAQNTEQGEKCKWQVVYHSYTNNKCFMMYMQLFL